MQNLLSGSWLLFGGVVLLVAFAIYWASIPRPFPEIPYSKDTATKPFGDIPAAAQWQSRTGEIATFIQARVKELDSPIIQLFLNPFGKPWIVIADSSESHDIMVRRSKEFERSSILSNLVRTITPFSHVLFKTNDQWRTHRRLIGDTMSPSFLQNVGGPKVHAAFMELTALWKKKVALSQGLSFDVSQDTYEAMLDGFADITFPVSPGASKTQEAILSTVITSGQSIQHKGAVATFPCAPSPVVTKALESVVQSTLIAANSPLGHYHHAFAMRFYPRFRRANAIRNQLTADKLYDAWRRLVEAENIEKPESFETHAESAADLLVSAEVKQALKEGRAPRPQSPILRDELFGFIMAGYDTTGSTLQWGIKLLSTHQDKQARLRQELKTVFHEAAAQGSVPQAHAIATRRTIYLDAFIEEILRFCSTILMNIRTAVHDTEIFGYDIPKGTDVFMLTNGPSITSPAIPIDESKRGAAENPWVGNWDESTLADFQPERWLAPNGKGDLDFEPQAGPQLNFGAGPRGCFGKKLGLLALRTAFTVLVWNFEFQPLDVGLNSMKARGMIPHRPQQVFVRLAEIAV